MYIGIVRKDVKRMVKPKECDCGSMEVPKYKVKGIWYCNECYSRDNPGTRCPRCGKEMSFHQPTCILFSNPLEKDILISKCRYCNPKKVEPVEFSFKDPGKRRS